MSFFFPSKLNNWHFFLLGSLSGLSFAPIFLFPALITLSVLCYYVRQATSLKEASTLGMVFGFGHFLSSMYWISIGITVYIDQFWWAFPFALFGLPLIMACFISMSSALSYGFKESKYYQFMFSISWVFFEWLRSWIFTGLPWNLLGYSLAFSDILIQGASIFGIYGLSFIVIYISTSFYQINTAERKIKRIYAPILTSILIIVIMGIYGYVRLEQNPTQFSNISVRLVQPSIRQDSKWDLDTFWNDLDSHVNLSKSPGNPDLIIWSEAALVIPYNYPPVKAKIIRMLSDMNAILITGGVTTSMANGSDDGKLYTSMNAISKDGESLFEYHKAHLVPFGEYMPLKDILPIKKLTHGIIDYTAGKRGLVRLAKPELIIRPLICYESIFPKEVSDFNGDADIIINITNDAWYGNSSGPYQHFHMSRIRAVENGLPLIRVANNGISASIDPLGRVIDQLQLNEVGILDIKAPLKLQDSTLYFRYQWSPAILALLLIAVINLLIAHSLQKFIPIMLKKLD